MGRVESTEMSDQRALLTDTERRILSGEKDVKDNYRYSVESRVRTRLKDRFRGDVDLLRENQPEMYEILENTVCSDDIAESDSSAEWSDTEIDESVAEVKQEMDSDFEESAEATTPVVEGDRTDIEAKEEIYEELEESEESADGTDDVPDISSRVWEVVEDVAEGWDDDDRLHNRKQAAAEVLHHAVETGEPVGKSSEIVEEVREKYPVVGQNEETYWRKNIRDVLSEVGNYSRGSHKYTVASLDQDGDGDE